MSESSSYDNTQRNSPGSSSAMTGLFAIAIILLLMAGGFGAWKFLASRKAEVAAIEAERAAQLSTYQVDPKTGKLTKTGGAPANIWPEAGVADFSLIDQTGKTVTLEDLLGKPWAVSFVHSRCNPQGISLMRDLQQISDDLKGTGERLVTITVDPDFDTPEVFSQYAAGFEADPKRWLFLSGDKTQIYGLMKTSFLLPFQEAPRSEENDASQLTHPTKIFHVNAEGQVVGQYNGLDERERRNLVLALKDEAKELASRKDPGSRPPDIGDFELTERSGRTITNKDLLGEPWAVCFVFTRCAGQCLSISGRMANLQRELDGAPVRLVTITVDPTYDTPEVLRNYADGFGADPDRWLFLTGKQDYVYRLLWGHFRQIVKEMTGAERQKGYEVLHTPDVLHIDASGHIVKRYSGMSEGDMTRLRKALLAEAKQLAENPRPMRNVEPSSNPNPAVAEKLSNSKKGE